MERNIGACGSSNGQERRLGKGWAGSMVDVAGPLVWHELLADR